jgi:hypothetical protein
MAQNFTELKDTKPIVIVGSSSSSKSSDDDFVLEKMSEAINSMGVYHAEISQDTFAEGVSPAAGSFSSYADARYVLTCSLSREGDVNKCMLTLWSLKDGSISGSNEVDYANIDELTSLAAITLGQIFFLVPPPKVFPIPQDLKWRSQKIYLNFALGSKFHLVESKRSDDNARASYPTFALHAEVGIEYQFLLFSFKKMSLGLTAVTGGVFSWPDRVSIRPHRDSREVANFDDMMVQIPVSIKLNWYPIHYMVSLKGGIYFNALTVGNGVKYPVMGFLLGMETGIRVGSNILALFFEYTRDIGEGKFPWGVYLPDNGINLVQHGRLGTFQRNTLTMGISFKWGVLPRPQKEVIPFTTNYN